MQANNPTALLEAAREACERAHARYSGFPVGAALSTTVGRVFSGCSVENASYGLTTCAEVGAVQAAVLGGMEPGELAMIAVYARDERRPCMPCGRCRQVIAEFARSDCKVVVWSEAGGLAIHTLADLLPNPFVLV